MLKGWTIGLLGLLLAIGGPSVVAAIKPVPERSEAEPIYNVGADDAEMNAAKAHAIATLPQFYRRLAAPGRDEGEFMVKFDILPGEPAEFVWATDLDRSRVPMTGRLINQPVETDHRIGQRVAIAEAEIIDWTYRRGRVMQGGFTNRVLLGRMPPDEAESKRVFLGW